MHIIETKSVGQFFVERRAKMRGRKMKGSLVMLMKRNGVIENGRKKNSIASVRTKGHEGFPIRRFYEQGAW